MQGFQTTITRQGYMVRIKLFWVWIGVLVLVIGLAGCSKRLAELKVKYPVTDGRHSILDEEALSSLQPDEIKGLYVSDIKELMGDPVEMKSYYERKSSERFFLPGKVQVRSDDWSYDSNNGSKRVTVKFEDKAVTDLMITVK
jgi:hypothetical protein